MTSTVIPASGGAPATVGQVAHLSVAKAGESANGDHVVVRRGHDGRTLLGVIDGLGHGAEAQRVARAAADALATAPPDAPVGELLERMHSGLRGTRGAAATLCLVADGRLEACGVGNVELRCAETEIPFVLSPGILGVRVQRFRVCTAQLKPTSRLVIFSDGIQSVGRLEEWQKLPLRDACAAMFHKHRRSEDDATLLLAELGWPQ